MNANEQELFEFRNGMFELARAVQKRPPLDEADYMFYWKKLEDVPLPIVLAALDAVGKEQNYFPTVARVREKCRVTIDARRQAEHDRIMKDCDHGYARMETFTDAAGVERMRKCAHYAAAKAAMDAIGSRLALPPAGTNSEGRE